jgi:hypothetical protein
MSQLSNKTSPGRARSAWFKQDGQARDSSMCAGWRGNWWRWIWPGQALYVWDSLHIPSVSRMSTSHDLAVPVAKTFASPSP